MKKPVIAIPIGDPAGVGPEIVAKSIASDEVFQIAVCVIVGDRKILEKAIEITGENLKINCRLQKIEDNVCMCKEFRDQIADPEFEGYCHCRLYYKEK